MNYEQIYLKNLEYFKDFGQEIINNIKTQNTSNIEIVVGRERNNDNISIDGNKLYPDNKIEAITLQVNNYIKKPSSFSIPPSRGIDGLRKKYKYLNSSKHLKYLEKIETISPLSNNRSNTFKEYVPFKESLPYLLMFGIGSAEHIQKLIKNIDIKHLVIIDKDFSMLKASMYMTNWKDILDYFSQNDYTLEFKILTDPDKLAKSLLKDIYNNKPYLLFNIPYYIHYNSSFTSKVVQNYTEDVLNYLSGQGFYDDEIVGLKHTMVNVANNKKVFNKKGTVISKVPLFIVGSGPSIDRDIENIKKYQKDAIIFSAATAIKVLEKNNIRPDFHFEKERLSTIYKKLTESLSKEFLKSVSFIGLNVISPDVLDLFDNAKIFFRSNDSSNTLIKSKNIQLIKYCDATTTNAILSIALQMGFKEIYLFGVDMGYKNESSHHSKHSVYNDKSSSFTKWKANTLEKTFEGNFNRSEKFLTSDILLWSKQVAEETISSFQNVEIYNCSDGLFIEGTHSLYSDKIVINNKPENKNIVLKEVESGFSIDSKELQNEFSENFKREKTYILSTLDKMIELLNVHVTSNLESYKIMDKIYHIISEKDSILFPLLNGTVSMIFRVIYSHSHAADDKITALEFTNKSFNYLKDFFNEVKYDISDLS